MDHIFLGKFLKIFWITFFWIRRNFSWESSSDVRAFLGFFWDFCGISRLQISGIFLEFFYGFSGPAFFSEIFVLGFSWKQSGFGRARSDFLRKNDPKTHSINI